jgi:hypothetical protein
MNLFGRYRWYIASPGRGLVFLCGIIAALSQIPASHLASAQNPTAPPEATAVVRLRVRPKIDGKDKGLGRKRFYLIRGSLADNQALIQQFAQQPVVSRECYYRGIKASDALIAWLNRNDCESVYCHAIELESVSGPAAVPEFQNAFDHAPKEYVTPELKLAWLTTLLPDAIRDGFYRQKRQTLNGLVAQAEATSRAPVMSVMTDRLGVAYFTDLRAGLYTVTNLLPIQVGKNSVMWTCEVKVRPEDLSLQKTYVLASVKGNNLTCVGVETPLPACPANDAVPPK